MKLTGKRGKSLSKTKDKAYTLEELNAMEDMNALDEEIEGISSFQGKRRTQRKRHRKSMVTNFMSRIMGGSEDVPKASPIHPAVLNIDGKDITAIPKEEKKPSGGLSDDDLDLLKMVLGSNSSIYNSYKECLADPDRKDDAYFPAKSGWMVMKRGEIGGNAVVLTDKVKDLILVDDVPQSIDVTISNKIPKSLLEEIIGSFNRVYTTTKDEAAAQIYRKRGGDREYFVYYPTQVISGARVQYSEDPNIHTLRNDNDLIMELHSHNVMGAFFSGGDNSNEKECGFYMVIGHYGSAKLEYKCRVKWGDIAKELKACEVFDMTQEEEEALFTSANITDGNPEIDSKISKADTRITAFSWRPSEYHNPYEYTWSKPDIPSASAAMHDPLRGQVFHAVVNFFLTDCKINPCKNPVEFGVKIHDYVTNALNGLTFDMLENPWFYYMKKLVESTGLNGLTGFDYMTNFNLRVWYDQLDSTEKTYIAKAWGVKPKEMAELTCKFEMTLADNEETFAILYLMFGILHISSMAAGENTEFPIISSIIKEEPDFRKVYAVAETVSRKFRIELLRAEETASTHKERGMTV